MNKKIMIVIFLLVCVFITGCKENDTPFLSYQNEAFEAKAVLEIKNEKYQVAIQKTDSENCIISFLEPDALKGVNIEKTAEGVFFSVGEIRMPIEEKTNVTAEALRLFCLSQDDMTDSTTELINGVKVNVIDFSDDLGEIKLFLSTKSSLPLKLEADINGIPLTLNFSEFKIIPKQT